VSPDRPFVDGAARSSDDLRAEVRQQDDPGLEDALATVEDTRAELGATAAELARRLDVPARLRDQGALARDTVSDAVRTHAGLVAGVAAVLVTALVVRRVRAHAQP